MYLKKIKIKNFRNIKSMELDLNKNINVFIGNNAQGKTSILESIYVLALTKSMRTTDDGELIYNQSDFSLIKGELKQEHYTKKMEIVIEKNKKTLKLNGNLIKKMSDYVSILKIIIFSPDDLDIVKKSPSDRRNLMNVELCQLFPNYMKVLNEYNKVLKMRNEYIRNYNQNINYDYLNILTDKLIERALVIMDYREKFLQTVNLNIESVYFKIMKQKGLNVVYEKSLNMNSKASIRNFYQDNLYQELSKKMTLFGPHRDDFTFYLDGMDLKSYGSQGQQRSAILAFKLSEINLFKESSGNYPIVLLDDIFSELDIEKRNQLLKFIKSNIQFIITTTDIKNISSKILDKASIFKIKNGDIAR